MDRRLDSLCCVFVFYLSPHRIDSTARGAEPAGKSGGFYATTYISGRQRRRKQQSGGMNGSVNCAVTQTIDSPVTEHISASRCSRWRRKQTSAVAVICEVCVRDGLSTGLTSCVYIGHGGAKLRPGGQMRPVNLFNLACET